MKRVMFYFQENGTQNIPPQAPHMVLLFPTALIRNQDQTLQGEITLTAVPLLTSSQTGLSPKPVSFGPHGILFRVKKQPIHRAKIPLPIRHRLVLFQPQQAIRKRTLKTQIPFHTAQAQSKVQLLAPLLAILLCRPFLDSRSILNRQQSMNKSKTQKLFYSEMLSSSL